MGNLHIALAAFIGNIGCDVVLGPKPNKETLNTGVKYAPELVCLPFKVTLGDLFQSLKKGSDTLAFIGGGDWSCRFGYYGRIQCSILKKFGYEFKPLFVSFENTKSIASQILSLNNNSWTITLKNVLRAFTLAWHKSKLVNITEELARRTRPFEIKKGVASELEREFLKTIEEENSIYKLRRMKQKIKESFFSIKENSTFEPLRILIVGESYCVIEPFVNFDLIEYLGGQGVLAEPFLTTHQWLFYHALRKDEGSNLSKEKAKKLAEPFWAYGTGGEDQVSIGHAINAARQGFDGIIHLMPFSCMPETAALPVFEKISELYSIPFLNFSLDEYSSPTGFYTRIEAFLDCLMLRRKKNFNKFKGAQNEVHPSLFLGEG